MSRSNGFHHRIVTLLMMILVMLPLSVSASVIKGHIKTLNPSKNIEGAHIVIQALNKRVTSNAAGEFVIAGIKPGSYTVLVSYLGYQSEQQSVILTDTDVKVDFYLKANKGVNEEVLVYGQMAAMNSSINRQRQADGLVSIIDSKSMGDFPDQNISESLQRLPGVSIERDQGEGRYVVVRGLNPDYNAVSVNGVNVPSPDADRRAVALDVIPNDLVGSVQVTKMVTPDKDANSIGGAIEITSLSAFDREGFAYKVYADASYNDLVEKISPKLGLTVSDTFDLGGKSDVLGIAFSASYYDRDFGSDNVETGGKWVFDDQMQVEGLEEIEQRDYTINRERLGLGLNIDYKGFEETDLYFRSLYASFVDTETRFANKIEFLDAEEEATALMPRTVAEKVAITKALKNRQEDQTIQSFVLGGQTRIDSWQLDYNLGISEAQQIKAKHIDGAEFKAGFDLSEGLTFSGGKAPAIFSDSNYRQASQYEIDEIEMAQFDAKDTQNSIKLDIKKEFFIHDYPTAVKVGTKFNQRKKTSQEDVLIFDEFDDLSANTLASFNTGTVDYTIGNFGQGISNKQLMAIIQNLESSDDIEKSSINDYTVKEVITAGYGMITTDIHALRVIAGLRYEQAQTRSQGKRYDDGTESVTKTAFRDTRSYLLPALLAKYALNEHMVMRAGWTNTLARPTFEQISPGAFIEEDDGDFEGEAGNPELESMRSTNIDISYEFYPGNTSVLSTGIFYKKIDDFIYETDISGEKLGLSSDYKMASWQNGDSASLFGIELNYVHPFDIGLLMGFNATYIDSLATLNSDDGKRDISLPGQSDIVANLLLGFEKGRYSFRLSGNYQSKALIKVEDKESPVGDIYQDGNMHWDFVAKIGLVKQLSMSFKIANLTDEPYYAYQYRPSYNYQYENYGRTFQLGFELANF